MPIDIDLERRLVAIEQQLANTQTVAKMILMSAGGSLPVTSVATTFSGNLIGTTDKYLEIYTNNYNRLLALKVVGNFVVPGSTAKLSLQQSDNGLISILSSSGLISSDTIWLKPRQSLYINTNDTIFSLGGSTFRVLLFDPLSFTIS